MAPPATFPIKAARWIRVPDPALRRALLRAIGAAGTGRFHPLDQIAGLAALCGHFPRLRMLKVGSLYAERCNLFSLEGIQHCTNLMSLSIGGHDQAYYGSPIAVSGSMRRSVPANYVSELGYISDLVKLGHLSAFGNRISNLGPLASLRGLHYLDLGRNAISSIEPLRDLHDLRFLSVAENRIACFEPLCALRNLRSLHVQGNPAPDLEVLLVMDSLQSLEIDASTCQNAQN